ncbi:GNAT family N-acetyltransferase [Roseateles sp.]|uniref:GNAT family N-acetyltransferase n=1 Tax=Roseateles sp. TaxID=1971397 RepID=UPI003D0EF912
MPIRMATLADIPQLVEGGRRMHALTRFKHFDYNAERVAKAFESLITQGQHKYVFMVAEGAEQRVVGALIGVLEQHIFSEQLTASIMHFDVLPEARMGGYGVRLLKAFERWAENRHVVEICFGVNSETASIDVGCFAGRLGYSRVGVNYIRRSKQNSEKMGV